MKKLRHAAIAGATLALLFATSASAQPNSPCSQQCAQTAQACINSLTQSEKEQKFGAGARCQEESVRCEARCPKK
jgi:hypothetical protein